MTAVIARGVSKSFGGYTALKNVNLTVEPGERRAIIGPNGAGKTTLFSMIAGQRAPTSGAIQINGVDTTGKRPDQIWRIGLSRTFQRNQLFQQLTVWENVELACAAHSGGMFARRALDLEVASILDRVNLLDASDERGLKESGLALLYSIVFVVCDR